MFQRFRNAKKELQHVWSDLPMAWYYHELFYFQPPSEPGEVQHTSKVACRVSFYWHTLRDAIKLTLCAFIGHRVEDCSYGGPEHGNMDACCTRCGKYWHCPLY